MKILKPKPLKGKGITVLMNGQIFCTSSPTQEDAKFIQQSVYWFSQWKEVPDA